MKAFLLKLSYHDSLYKLNLVCLYHTLYKLSSQHEPLPTGKYNTCNYTNIETNSHYSVTDPLCTLVAWHLFKHINYSLEYLFPEPHTVSTHSGANQQNQAVLDKTELQTAVNPPRI